MEWISVKDKLPEEDVPVLACDNRFDSDIPQTCDYSNGKWWEYAPPGHNVEVTHWMPLPELP